MGMYNSMRGHCLSLPYFHGLRLRKVLSGAHVAHVESTHRLCNLQTDRC